MSCLLGAGWLGEGEPPAWAALRPGSVSRAVAGGAAPGSAVKGLRRRCGAGLGGFYSGYQVA